MSAFVPDVPQRSPADTPPAADAVLTLTGERTIPDLDIENYWFRRHQVVYQRLAPQCAGRDVLVVGDRHLSDVARHFRSDGDLARCDESIVGRFEIGSVAPVAIPARCRQHEKDRANRSHDRPPALLVSASRSGNSPARTREDLPLPELPTTPMNWLRSSRR